MLVSPVYENAFEPISERDSGRLIVLSDEHSWKQFPGITVTFGGMVMLVSPVVENALEPISSMVLGSLTDVIPSHQENPLL